MGICQSGTNIRGVILEKSISQNSLNVLKTGTPTHPGRINDSIIDLTTRTPDIAPRFKWSTGRSLLSSDHFPVFINTYLPPPHPSPIRLTKKANWGIYKDNEVWR